MNKLVGTWVIGVSGGADSMTLLDMCYENKVDIIVAHMNYQKRKSASIDEKGVRDYCLKRNIPFFKRSIDNYEKGNFQAQARSLRYAFFKELIHKYHCKGVLIAHHLNDVLETYLMQKKRNSIPEYYGIKEEVMLHGILVKRPLLSWRKQDLIDYCIQHKVVYFEDESNADDLYTRNWVRHHQVETMNLEEQYDLLEEITKANAQLLKHRTKVAEFYQDNKPAFTVKLIRNLSVEEQLLFLRYWILLETENHRFGLKRLKEIQRLLKNPSNWQYPLNKKMTMINDYGTLRIHMSEPLAFYVEMDTIKYVKHQYFETRTSGKKIEGVKIRDEDLPIVIRNFQNGDKIKLRMGTKRVSRFFIDRKIPIKEREVWPVVVNNVGEIIYVYGIGCDIQHYGNNLNLFVVK